ncbi:MAG: AsmA family protein, partial [Chromatiales bacterium]|nr:AsmA family protein [Chromatiales bacterium]
GDALPKTITVQRLETTAINSHFSANTASQQVALDKFLLNFDQSTFKGHASVTNFSKPAIRYDFDINSVNIDRYFPPTKKSPSKAPPTANSTTTAAASSAAEEPLPIPVALLRTLDIDGSLRLGALQVMNLHTQNMVAKIRAKDGKIDLAPLSAELYQGKFGGEITIDVRKNIPVIKVKEKLTEVASGPLLKDLLGKDYVTGKALLNANITTKGDRISQFKKGLNGTAELRFEDGAVNGIDIAQLIRDAYAAYKKQPAAKSSNKPQTDFALLSASVKIKNGVVFNKDLSAKSPLLRIAGAGQADLVSEKIDYRVKAGIVNTLEGQGGKSLSDLKGLTIPLIIKGTFSEPKFSVDLAQLLNEKAKAQIDAAKAKARNRAQEKLNAEKERLKKDLLNKLKSQFKLPF